MRLEQVWPDNEMHRIPFTHSTKEKYSRWVKMWTNRRSDRFTQHVDVDERSLSMASTPAAVVEANFRGFLQKFTVIDGSETGMKWESESTRNRRRVNGPEIWSDYDTLEDPASQTTEIEETLPAQETSDISEEQETVDSENTEDPESEAAEDSESIIWRPNKRDENRRKIMFSHPSQSTLAEATKELRSKWSSDTFRRLDLVKGLSEAIEEVTLKHLEKAEFKLTPIQKLAIPLLTSLDKSTFDPALPAPKTERFRSFLIAAETGSGKTLAYLVPLLNRLKREEEWGAEHRNSPLSIIKQHKHASPRSLILVPTSELAEQILNILKDLCHKLKFAVSAILPRFDDSVVRYSILAKKLDILISTPHRLNEFLQKKEFNPQQVRYVVIDEADSLFDRSFKSDVFPILDKVDQNLTHLVACSATIPVALEKLLHSRYPDMQRIVTPRIHSASRRINFEVCIQSDKQKTVSEILRSIQKDHTEPSVDVKRAIVFCNTRESAREIYEYLKAEQEMLNASEDDPGFLPASDPDLELIPFTRENYDRHTALKRFNAKSEGGLMDPKKLRVLITTDMASRGLDTMTAKNVVLYEVPYSSIDLIHRLGRTARAGTRGRAFLVVGKHEYRGWIKLWVDDIQDRLVRGRPLI